MQIKVGTRFRKDLGDIESLALSIVEDGLLHPIVVSEDGTLIAGLRRLMAWRMVGRPDQEIPRTVIPLNDIARGEIAENGIRKDFTPSEAWSVYQAIKAREELLAKKRQGTRTDLQLGANLAPGELGKSRNKAARYTGRGHTTLEKIGAVVQAAEKDPEYRPLVEEMDRTGRVNRAYLKYIQKSQAQILWAEQEQPCQPGLMSSGPVRASDRIRFQQGLVTLIEGDCCNMAEVPDESVDVVLADPPFNIGLDYGVETNDRRSQEKYLEFTEAWLNEAMRVLKPGGQLYSIMPLNSMSQWLHLLEPSAALTNLLGELKEWFRSIDKVETKDFLNRLDKIPTFRWPAKWHLLPWCKTMANLHREQTYLRAWEPIIWLIKGDRPNVFRRSYRFETDKDWIVGPSAIGEVQAQPIRKGHPTPRPTWLTAYFLFRSTEPGMVVLDPTVGSGTTAWVCQLLNRQCIAYDINRRYLQQAAAWLKQPISKPKEVRDCLSSYRQAQLTGHWEAEESQRMGAPLFDFMREMEAAVQSVKARLNFRESVLSLAPSERDQLKLWLESCLFDLTGLCDSL